MNPTLTEQVRQKYAWTAREVIQKEFSQLTVLGACCGGSDDGSCCSSARPDHVHDEVGICDVVASDALSPEDRAARGSYVDCIAGALSVGEFTEGLRKAGFDDVRVELTHPVADELFALSSC